MRSLGAEIGKVFQCIVCGRAWSSKQSLRAHMKAHKKEGYFRTNIIARREKWTQFLAVCDKHKTTSCRLLDQLIEAVIKGEEQGIVTIASQNPVVIQVNHVVLGAPRGRYSHIPGEELLERLQDPGLQRWPPNCEHTATYKPVGGLVGCRRKGIEVTVRDCWICFKQRDPGA